MSDDGLKTGKSTKGKNKAGSKKELKPAQIEVELDEQVDNQKFKDPILILSEIQTYLLFRTNERYIVNRTP